MVCPACGAAQYEPRLVVSTFCRSCGVHLSIEKRKVTASTATRSGAAGVDDLWNKATEPARPQPKASPSPPEPAIAANTRPPADSTPPSLNSTPHSDSDAAPAPLAPSASPQAALTPLSSPASPSPLEQPASPQGAPAAPSPTQIDDADVEIAAAAQTGFGAFLQTVSKTPAAPASSSPAPSAFPATPQSRISPPNLDSADPATPTLAHLTRVRASAVPSASLIPSVPATAPDSTLERMRAQSTYRQGNFKEVECFDCGHKLKVSRSSKSADCTQCGAVICLEDLDINLQHTTRIRTRGSLTIRKPGRVSTTTVECKNLRCQGTLDAETLHCQQDAVFCQTGSVDAVIHCRHLVVEKGADITFNRSVLAEDMTLNGRVTGTLQATGKITIGSNGSMNGDITARSVFIEPGGELNGAMNIVRSRPAPPPPTPPQD